MHKRRSRWRARSTGPKKPHGTEKRFNLTPRRSTVLNAKPRSAASFRCNAGPHFRRAVRHDATLIAAIPRNVIMMHGMRRSYAQAFFILSLVLLDACGLIFAFQIAYFIRFQWPVFLHIFPASKGVPPSGLYYSSLFGLLPLWLVVFAYAGLYG